MPKQQWLFSDSVTQYPEQYLLIRLICPALPLLFYKLHVPSNTKALTFSTQQLYVGKVFLSSCGMSLANQHHRLIFHESQQPTTTHSTSKISRR